MADLIGDSKELENEIRKIVFECWETYWYDREPAEYEIEEMLEWINEKIDQYYT